MQSVRHLFSKGSERNYEKGQIILYQGELNQSAFLINKGFIKVYDITASGTEKLMLLLGPGDIFPIIWSKKPNEGLHYFYESYSDTNIQTISRTNLTKQINKSHQFTKELLEYFMDQYQQLNLRIECIDGSSAKHKVAQVLEYVAGAHGTKIAKSTYRVELNLTHQSIANMAGITRETASIQLKQLQDDGLYKNGDGLTIYTDRIDRFLSDN